MKKILIVAFLVICSTTTFSQSKLGEVACVYITSPDLDSSVAFYEKLDFKKTGSNTFPVPWAQVSDGSLLIMMRKDGSPYIGLTYYVTDIEKTAGELEKEGIVFTQQPKPGDPIKRYYFKSPDGFNIMLASNLGGFVQPTGISMLNMKQEDYASPEKYPNKQCGVFGEFCHPVTNLATSLVFWKKIGFTVKYETAMPYPHAILSDGLMIIGLHQTGHFNFPAITYFSPDAGKKVQQLKEKGLKNFSEMAGPDNQVLSTFERQHVFIFSIGM
ncbi:MAG: VOC family protein [Chitinophagaceae bacterium]